MTYYQWLLNAYGKGNFYILDKYIDILYDDVCEENPNLVFEDIMGIVCQDLAKEQGCEVL